MAGVTGCRDDEPVAPGRVCYIVPEEPPAGSSVRGINLVNEGTLSFLKLTICNFLGK